MSRILRPLVALVALALLAGGGLWAVKALMDPNSYYGCDKFERAAAVTEGLITQTPSGDQREALVAQLADLRQQAKDDGCKPVTAEPSATPTGTPTQPEDKEPAASDSWTPHFYTLDPGKTADRNFGPPVKGGKKAAAGDAAVITDINAEFRERMLKDPALLCGNGGLIIDGKDGGKDCVDELIASKSARDEYFDRVFDEVKWTKVEKRLAQYVESAYMVVPTDGIPRIVKVDTYRPSEYYVLVVKTKSGETYSFRLECGFQWDTGKKHVPQVYTPVVRPPFTPVPPCINGGDRDEDGKCVVPPKETTPPAETPTATPTPTPTEPTPTPTEPTPEPSCPGKTCETPVAPPSERPAPSSTPSRNPETSPPAEPEEPAGTATPVVTAPGATKAPDSDPASPVPTVSQPGGGDEPVGGDPGDPDDN